MKRMMTMGLCIVAAFAMATATASAEGTGPKTFLRTAGGGLLKKGDILTAFSSNLVFTTSGGNLECSKNIIAGPVKTNGKEKPSGEINLEESTGEEAGGLCKTTTPFGPAEIATSNKPWKIKFITSSAKVQVSTGLGTKKVIFTSTFPSAGGAKCIFQTKKVLSEYNEPATPAPLVIKTVNQVFKLETGSTAGCPTEGKLNGSFSITKGAGTGGETVEVEVHK
jgi:hypothetical protein